MQCVSYSIHPTLADHIASFSSSISTNENSYDCSLLKYQLEDEVSSIIIIMTLTLTTVYDLYVIIETSIISITITWSTIKTK